MIVYKKIFTLLAVILFSAVNLFAQEICDDGIDNDLNGLIDLNDPGCTCSSGFPIMKSGAMCTGDLVLTSTSSGMGTYQWYYGGVAIVGETSQVLDVYLLPGGGIIGDYQVMWTDTSCHTSTINVTQTPVTINVSSDKTICIGESTNIFANGATTYAWDNGLPNAQIHTVTPLSTTLYHVTATNFDACWAVDSILITVSPLPTTPNITGSLTVCQGDSTELDAGGYTSYLWSTNDTTRSIHVFTGGLYAVTVSNDAGCKSNSTVTVTLSPSINYYKSESPASCYGYTDGTVTLNGSGGIPPLTYAWSNGSSTQNLSNVLAGNYYFTITDVIGCTSGGSATINQPTEVNVGLQNDMTICISDTIELFAAATGGTAPYNYYWDNNELSTIISVSPIVTTIYSVYAEDFSGCRSDLQSITVNVRPPLTLDMDISDYYVCKGDPVTISAQGYGGDGNYTYTLSDGTIITPPYSFYSTKTIKEQIRVTLTDNCVTPAVFDTITINLLPLPEFTFQPNITYGCQPLEIEFSPYSNSSSYTYKWDFGDTQSSNNSSVETNPVYTFENDGVFSVTLIAKTDSNCVNSLTVPELIEVYQKPTSEFSYDKSSASVINPIINFTNKSEYGYSYHWVFGDGDSSSVYSPLHKYPSITNVWYDVNLITISKKDCRDTSYQNIYITGENTIYAPTAFSPDNDNINDYWMVTGIGIEDKQFKLYIFDRWGEQVFYTVDPKEYWDGKINGHKIGLPGVYTWIVYYLDSENFKHTKSGKLMLLR